MVENLVLWVTAYAIIGVAFAFPFAWKGTRRIDPAAENGSWGFRVLILPGAAALWPLLLWRWSRVGRPDSKGH